MRLKRKFREEWGQPVNPIILCVSLLFVTTLIVGRGVYLVETGHAPRLGPGFWFLSLVYLGALFLIDIVKYDQRTFSPARLTVLAGYVLLAVSQMMQSGTLVASEVETGGFVLIGLTLLANMFDFGPNTLPE